MNKMELGWLKEQNSLAHGLCRPYLSHIKAILEVVFNNSILVVGHFVSK